MRNPLITILFLSLLFGQCGGINDQGLKLVFIAQKKIYHNQDNLEFEISNPKNIEIDSISIWLDEHKKDKINSGLHGSFSLRNSSLGEKQLRALIFSKGEQLELKATYTVLADAPPAVYSFEVVVEYPHDPQAFTQGLEFYKDTLFESTGLKGKSTLRKVNWQTGQIVSQVDLDNRYFGEGVSILNDRIYMLTWQEKVGLVFDPKNLKQLSSFAYGKSKEGWGLCNDKSQLYKSDGTHNIWILDPETLVEKDRIQVATESRLINNLNELEWVEGKIFANIWQRNGIAIIDPRTGRVEAVIDFSALKERLNNPTEEVLNGIAYLPEQKRLFVTGKNWDKLFEVKIIKP